jgi:undecaprenyl diphosphate synthase
MALKQVTDFTTSLPSRWFSSDANRTDKEQQAALQKAGQLPQHIAIIMDGNGRWAKMKGKTRMEGHIAGVSSVRDIVEACHQLGIGYLTLFTFSTENWKRPEQEISALMQLLIRVIGRESRKLHENNIRLHVIGEMHRLPQKVERVLRDCMELTKENNGLMLNLALSYSGQWDILQACRTIAADVQAGTLQPEAIDEQCMASYLSTAGIPDPELLIRTSGEFRLSNFLLWQSAYSEIHYTSIYWPDFRREQLYEALYDFQQRERRFGQTSEQLQTRTLARGQTQNH